MTHTKVPLRRALLFAAVVCAGTAIDLGTKSWIFNKLGMPYQTAPIGLIPGIFSLTTSLNEGALFGMGQGMTPVFAGLSLLAVIGIAWWLFFAGAGNDLWLVVALGMVMGGIFGNLYDRLGFPGLIWNEPYKNAGQPVFAVRDWLHFEIQRLKFDWPVFNIADSLLVAGAIMLFVHVAWREPRQRQASNSQIAAKAS
jgi:signal peptidase II